MDKEGEGEEQEEAEREEEAAAVQEAASEEEGCVAGFMVRPVNSEARDSSVALTEPVTTGLLGSTFWDTAWEVSTEVSLRSLFAPFTLFSPFSIFSGVSVPFGRATLEGWTTWDKGLDSREADSAATTE